jgi:hypothetical protein
METASERRKRKLELVLKLHGGLAAVAKAATVNPAALDQIVKGTLLPPKKDGSQNPRSLGDANAHAIEDAFGLGRGWFDAPDETAPSKVSAVGAIQDDEEDLILAFRKLPPDVKQELVRDLMALALRYDSNALGALEKQKLGKTAPAEVVSLALQKANDKLAAAEAAKPARKEGKKRGNFNLNAGSSTRKTRGKVKP